MRLQPRHLLDPRPATGLDYPVDIISENHPGGQGSDGPTLGETKNRNMVGRDATVQEVMDLVRNMAGKGVNSGFPGSGLRDHGKASVSEGLQDFGILIGAELLTDRTHTLCFHNRAVEVDEIVGAGIDDFRHLRENFTGSRFCIRRLGSF